MEAVARFTQWRVPVLNKDVGYLLFGALVVTGGYILLATHKVSECEIMPVICLIVGHFYGSHDKGSKGR